MTTRVKLSDGPDLILACAVAAACAAACLLVKVTLVRVLCAVPLGLICPGYAVTAALFAKSNLERPMRVMLTLSLSVITLILGGIVLNTAGGIYESSWVILLLVVIGATSALALVRRDARGAVTIPAWRPSPKQTVNTIVLLLALAIGVGAVIGSRIPLGAPNSVGYETLTAAPTANNSAVRFQVYSARQHTTSYQLRVYVNQRLVLSRRLQLRPGRASNITVPVPASKAASSVNASVVMLGGHWTPRHVYLTLPAA